MATLLPLAVQTFEDDEGNPLAGGTVYFMIPSTTTPKDTWSDAGETTLNTNPILLDAAGQNPAGGIYGSGSYRQVVYDADGNLIWDRLTADTAVGGVAYGGVSTGSANAQVIAASSFSQQDGQQIGFIAGFSNNSALTVAPGGGSGIPVLADTDAGPVPLSGGEVVTDNYVLLEYESARGAFHLVNPIPGDVITAFLDSVFRVQNSVDPTKQLAFDVSGVSAATTRTLAVPNASGTIALTATTLQLAVADQLITGGANITSLGLGTKTSGTTTLDYGARPFQDLTNGGAFTLAPDSQTGWIMLDITNNGSAGAITTSGWTKVVGAFTTTNGNKFRCACSTGPGGSLLSITAMQ